MITLLGSSQHPLVRKVRIVLAEKKLLYTLEPMPKRADDEFIRQNPLHEEPCLITGDGVYVYDSRVIVAFVEQLSPFAKLIPTEGRVLLTVKMLEVLSDGVLERLMQYKNHKTKATQTSNMQRQIEGALGLMAETLGEKTHYIGHSVTLADIVVGNCLAYLDDQAPEIEWQQKYTYLEALYSKLLCRESFRNTAFK